MTRERIYLDHAATSPVVPEVAAEIARCLGPDGPFGNPSSAHTWGREAARLVERARVVIAARVGADPDGLVFTSGATEANNLALKGVLAAAPPERRHLVTTRIEHKSVLDTAAALEAAGVTVTYIGCNEDGIVAADDVARAIRSDTALVSVMRVNNETGMIQPVPSIAQICRARGVLLHVDAAQAAGRMSLDVRREGVDLCSLTAHKLGGPKGIGALWLRSGLPISPLLHGGEQQRGLRAGTLPTHQIAGMAKAYQLANPIEVGPHIAALKERLWAALERIDGTRLNGRLELAAPHILNVAFPGVDGEALRFALRDVAVSAGSACMSDSPEASHVLSSMGLTDAAAASSIRFSFGAATTADEVDAAAARVADALSRLRRLALGAPGWCSMAQAARLTDVAV